MSRQDHDYTIGSQSNLQLNVRQAMQRFLGCVLKTTNT